MADKVKEWLNEGEEQVSTGANRGNEQTRNTEAGNTPQPTAITSPDKHVVELRIIPGAPGEQRQQTVVIGSDVPGAVQGSGDGAQKRQYLEQLERWIATNTALLLSTREAVRTEFLKQDLGLFESISDYPTVEERRSRYPLEDDFIFDQVRKVLDEWKNGQCTIDEAYSEVRYAIEHPEELKKLAQGIEEEDTDEEEDEED